VQYFPSVDYLVRVLTGLSTHVTHGGTIFVGDVRSLPLLKAFYTMVELQRAPAAMKTNEFKRRVEERIAREEELVVHPYLFSKVAATCPNIDRVSILPRRGCHHNELTKFRYDAILHIGDGKKEDVKPSREDLSFNATRLCDRDVLAQAARSGLTILEVPNLRLAQEHRLLELLEQEDGPATIGALREEIQNTGNEAIDPDILWSLGSELGLDLNISWAAARDDGSFDISFGSQEFIPREYGHTIQTWADCGNHPLNSRFFARIVPGLRQFLNEKLPGYMVPTYFHRIEEWPLNQGGKIDRKALPPPDRMNRGSEPGLFVPPRTQTETLIAAIWRELFGLQRVGVEDNFFELGGHSLLAAQVIARLRKLVPIDLKLRALFEFPTVGGLASKIDAISKSADEQFSLPS
jgi:acyl carrier protein